jgi:hypothetical protein
MTALDHPCPYCHAEVHHLCRVVRSRTRADGFPYNSEWGYIHAARRKLAEV